MQVNHCNFLSWIDKPVCARGLEVIPTLMAKMKQAEVDAETEKALAKTKEDIHAKKSAFNHERVVALGKRNMQRGSEFI